MTKKQGIIFIVLSIIVIALLILPNRFGRELYTDANTTLFEVVPTDASIIIEFNSLSTLRKKLKNKNYTIELQQLALLQQFSKDIKLFDKLFYKSENNRQIVHEGELLTVAQIESSSNLEFLHIAKHPELKVDFEEFNKAWLAADNVYSNYVFEGFTVYEFEFSTFEKVSMCIANEILLLSRSNILIEKALAELVKPKGNISRQHDFLKVRSKTGNNADFSTYINFETLPVFLTNFTNKAYVDVIPKMSSWGNWIGLDIEFLDKGLDLNGYFVPNTTNKFFKTLKKETLVDNITIDKMLPENTAFTFSLGSEDFRQFVKNKKNKETDFEKYFLSWMGESLTYVITEPTTTEYQNHQFWIAEIKNYELATITLAELSDENGALPQVDFPPHTLQGFLYEDLFTPIIGNDFKPIRNPYYTIINEQYVIFANSADALKPFVEQLDFEQTLAQDINYQEFKINNTQVSSINQYFNLANSFHLINAFLDDNLKESWAREFRYFEKIKPISIQLTPYNDLQVVKIKALFDKKGKQPTSVVWRSELESDAIIPPKVVKNHDTGENEIFVQDSNFKIYLLNKNGEILWTKQLNGKILSDIYQVDFYKNNKLQYLFNTTSQIHLIDRNKNNVDNYPRKLRGNATNGLTVLDYDGQKNYRIFVACNDGNIYGFLKNGEPLNGWSPQENVGIVSQPIQYFLIDDLDYIVTLNDSGLVHVFQRNGDRRIVPTDLELNGEKINSEINFDDISGKHKRVVAVDSEGKGYVANLQGTKFNLNMSVGNNEDVKFCLADVVGDIRKDYILLSERDLQINHYNHAGKFKKAYKTQLSVTQNDLFSLQLSNQEKAYIGTVSNINNEIFLLDNHLNLIKDFPLAGSTRFEITDFFGDGKNILTVANENLIYTYRLSYLAD
ncbi:MAG: hypothetical protein AB8G11_07560 [Saprospiraceae bacterium]